MRLRALTTVGFAAYILLGNICMMLMPQSFGNDVLMAATASMPEKHEDHGAMSMALVVPFSVHCEDCEEISIAKEHAGRGVSCAGHCLTQAKQNALAGFTLGVPLDVSAHTNPLMDLGSSVETTMRPLAMAPPPISRVGTIVLRL